MGKEWLSRVSTCSSLTSSPAQWLALSLLHTVLQSQGILPPRRAKYMGTLRQSSESAWRAPFSLPLEDSHASFLNWVHSLDSHKDPTKSSYPEVLTPHPKMPLNGSPLWSAAYLHFSRLPLFLFCSSHYFCSLLPSSLCFKHTGGHTSSRNWN